MAGALAARLEPGSERLIQAGYAGPVHEGAGIKKDDDSQAGPRDNDKVEISPALLHEFRIGRGRDPMRHPGNEASDEGAADMDDVGLLRQNHAGETHAGAPQVVNGSPLPQTQQTQDEEQREKKQPDFVDRVTVVENKPGRDRHGERGEAADIAADERLEL